MRLRRRREPEPPQNVRLVHGDGTVIPLECRYDGKQDGLHLWTAVVGPVAFGPRDSVRMDVLPPRTAVQVQVDPDGWLPAIGDGERP